GVSGGSGFTFVSTKCVDANYCYGAEYGNPDTVTSPTTFPFSAQAPSGVYWGWVESAAVFTASSGLRSSPPPTANYGNETLSAVPLAGSSSGYDFTVVVAAALVGLVVGAVASLALGMRRKPSTGDAPK
ncbi:MAG TPA: hypothetical protein VJR06_02195, partial [Nitrososphaerales archaeon]|nr:hypothetical protein [Nitrososphaerales archaeon]